MKKEFTKEGLKIGDVVGRFGFEQEVVEVLDNSFMISDGTWYTFEQAISHGWKIKDAEPMKMERFNDWIDNEASVEDSEEIPEGAVVMKQNVKCGCVTYQKGVQYNNMDEETLARFKKRGFVYQSKMV